MSRIGNSSIGLPRALSLRSVPRTFSVSSSNLLSDGPRAEIDQKLRAARTQEKEEIKGLNNKFSDVIMRVRKLEQENQVLETRWDLLKHADTYKSNADKIVNMFCNKLKQQLSDLEKEREHLKLQISQTQQMVEDFKGKYEDEINSRTAMENEFVVLKKEVDDAYFQKVELESKLEYLTNLIEFLKLLYAEELQELQSQIQSTAVTLKVNNKRQLDMKQIIDDIKLQHAEIAARNKQEADAWYQNKLSDLENDKARQNNDLRDAKNEFANCSRYLQKLKSDIDGLQNQRASLESNIRDTDERGQIAINEAKQHIQQLQEALRKIKTDMAEQMREHQELLNANLALDMEIATYKKLLDGEEERDGVPASGTITRVVSSSSVNPKGAFVRKNSKFMT
ncbi:keratin, type II cytoskeletal 8-like [Chiloscyllium plagiosum]|uniref:keratin, type II cytoskeletal 8-like n=1 Tax=Chiloscyllium plagiosum TaxID=36176 RepID=UPI001CB84988|nr:keratin, type II cytoskeletal 8-like [Chiloscyllium plagiosum]